MAQTDTRAASPASPAELAEPDGDPTPTTWLHSEATIALRLIVLGVAFVFAAWLVMRVQLVAVAAFVGFAQVALLWPIVRPLRRFLPRVVAALVVVLVYLAAFGGLLWFVVSGLINTWPDLVDAVIGGTTAMENAAREAGWQIPPQLAADLTAQLQARAGQIAGGIGTATMTTLTAVGNLTTVLLISLFLTIFALTSGDDLWRLILSSIPRRRRPQADASFRRGLQTARWWMFASTVTGLVDGIFIGAGLWLLGVPLAVPIGALTFVLGYIPMIGATLAGVLAILVALFFGGVQTALWALLLVLAVQQIEGNVLSPLLLSRAVSFHPVITLLMSTAGGFAFGLVGLFLAVPVAGILTALVVTWRRYPHHHEPGGEADRDPEPDDDVEHTDADPPGGAGGSTGEGGRRGGAEADDGEAASAKADRSDSS
ncbi:putative PurR-regulated permease PerM [Kineosphaera limosa]|uniref:AI-2E family transporter n=1 Tax=Kineosphaera limosa NBRC 100340 TaxID=1184609 RepID=K6W8S4_9MICO|nr:AI-2E family transporter [Kineosphaera limosa]NYD99640.1 putative PurR-regulated permease PerM [Kineosphaera limosa]GAB95595.1 hypothetical protein KILIM_024_00050 [Kineosphaera limosa NBRC 100340]